VVERPRGDHRVFKTQTLVNGWNLVKMETGRGDSRKGETTGWEGREWVCGEPAPPRL
jgi:hypothetical protein